MKNLLLTLGIASALLIAACGKKDEEQAPAAPAMQNPTPATTPPPAEGTQPNDPAAEPAEQPEQTN